MELVRTVAELQKALAGRVSSFVPTMGALHEGHLALIRRAAQAARPVVVSIFVNPTQFGPGEDFAAYPRQVESDVKAAATAGADLVFAPAVDEIYPSNKPLPARPLPPAATQPKLEDAFRPHHFAGVCQVVGRLFDLVKPRFAIFGEKDYQQLIVIQQLVALNASWWPGLEIIPHPTVREPDGLALSSRNAYLHTEDRERALGLWRALQAAQTAFTSWGQSGAVEDAMRRVLENHGLATDYAVVRDARTLLPLTGDNAPARALIAARLGKVRLIDNSKISES